MALIPETRYSGQIKPGDTDYPYGSAQNITTPGDGTGTPWEADIVNDILGFQQALLDAASIVPTNTPDKVGASQYLESVQRVSKLEARALADIATLIALTNVAENQVETVVDEGVFIYDSSKSGDNDGLRTFNGWVRQGPIDQIKFSDTADNSGVTLATIALSDNSHAKIEVYAGGLKGGEVAACESVFSIYRTTGVMTINLVSDITDGGDQDVRFEIEASGNDAVLKAYTLSDTWALSGNARIKSSGTVTIS